MHSIFAVVTIFKNAINKSKFKSLDSFIIKVTILNRNDYFRKGLKSLYLSTIDKEGFYARLGYSRCSPVLSLGSNAHRVPASMVHAI